MVGNAEVVLKKIISADTFELKCNGQTYLIGPDSWVELFPGCVARSTLPQDPTKKSSTVRVQVSAPAFPIYRPKRKEAQS